MRSSDLRRFAALATTCAIAWSGPASAAVWQWGCVGAAGNEQIAFNRERLIVISGKGPTGKLDDFVQSNTFEPGKNGVGRSQSVSATYQPDDANGGFSKAMLFAGDGGKLTLTEQSSRKIGHRGRLAFGCRDETFDRFRKTYRLERDGEPTRTVTFTCLEYQLSTRGGRTCR